MKKVIFLIITCAFSANLYGQEITEEQKINPGGFFFALGENILSNTLLYLADRYVLQKSWAQITPDSIWENLTGPWGWDGDEYFTNQFGHPYQGSTYHAAARSNGFGFYEAILFDAFGSISWELIFETNTPAINDLISTTLGGVALGEMFHRLYLEIPNPLALLVSPVDAFNDLITRRRPQYTRNIYSLKLSSGIGYTYAEQSMEREKGGDFFNLNARHMASVDISCALVYGNPFEQQSKTPYDHFELTLDVNLGFPFWYNLMLLSDAYLFSFSVIDKENEKASTGLSLHYDLFADRQIDFFSQALDWTHKYKKQFSSSMGIEFKGHIGWTVFNADTFYIHEDYSGLRRTKNNYGTGVNMKLIFAVLTSQWGTFELKAFIYEVFNIFQNENKDTGNDLCMFLAAGYSFPLGENWAIGIAASSLWHKAYYDQMLNTGKWTNNAKLYPESVQNRARF
jgi:hypothetical protein